MARVMTQQTQAIVTLNLITQSITLVDNIQGQLLVYRFLHQLLILGRRKLEQGLI